MKAFNILIGAAMAVGVALPVRAAAGYEVVCAASDTPAALKGCAKYVCPADDARETLQKALDEASAELFNPKPDTNFAEVNRAVRTLQFEIDRYTADWEEAATELEQMSV